MSFVPRPGIPQRQTGLALLRRRARTWLQRIGHALLTSLLLAFATPGTAEIVEKAIASTEEACADPCGADGHDDENCGESCGHCSCCAPLFTVALAPVVADEATVERTALFGFHCGEPYASGFRTAPFRPPSA